MLVCPVCSAALSQPLTCGDCGWVGRYLEGLPVMLPDPDLGDSTARSYNDNYDRIARDDLEEKIIDPRYIENLADNFCRAVELSPGAEVCDLGSGKGFLTRKLVERGAATVTAVDISLPYLVRLAGQPGVSPVMANAETLPYLEHFDVVVTTDVLEHVLNVGSFLYCVNRALRPGGRLYVRVPHREDLLAYSPHFGCPYRFVHFRSYDRALLRQTLESAGFCVDRLMLDGYLPGNGRPFWRGGPLRQKLYQRFEDWLLRTGRHPADVTLQPHGICQVFLQPTVLIAAARKVNRLVPRADGVWPGFELQ